MTSSEKNTLFYIGLFGVLAVVAWKLWPALRRAINSGSGGGTSVSGTGASSASPYYYPDYENESAQQGNLLSQLLNALSGGKSSQVGTGGAMPNSIGPGAYGATSPDLASALVNLISDGENASDQLAADSDYQVSQVTSGDQIASVPYQNFDVNQLAEPMPTDDTTDYSDMDTNNYGTGQIDDSGDNSGDDSGS
jgi:hypothetical protein